MRMNDSVRELPYADLAAAIFFAVLPLLRLQTLFCRSKPLSDFGSTVSAPFPLVADTPSLSVVARHPIPHLGLLEARGRDSAREEASCKKTQLAEGRGRMMVRFNLTIDPSVTETLISVTAREIDDDVRALQEFVAASPTHKIVGIRAHEAALLDVRSTLAFFTKDKAVYAHTASGDWKIKARLYEIESVLPPSSFVRISQSEIVNISAIERLDLSLSTTISVRLKDGTRYYVSRRQLRAFKGALGL